MRSARASKAAKKPTNVSINGDLLKRALVAYMKQRAGDQWLEENRAAIKKYNDLVAANGVFSDGIRRF